jgi:hypothetical protein
VTVGDLVGLLAGGGVVGSAVTLVWIMQVYLRSERHDNQSTDKRRRQQLDQADAALDVEQARRRAAEEREARLRRMVRDLGGDPDL